MLRDSLVIEALKLFGPMTLLEITKKVNAFKSCHSSQVKPILDFHIRKNNIDLIDYKYSIKR